MAAFPFWSPDSRSVGFFANEHVNRIDIDGGSLRELTRAPVGCRARRGVARASSCSRRCQRHALDARARQWGRGGRSRGARSDSKSPSSRRNSCQTLADSCSMCAARRPTAGDLPWCARRGAPPTRLTAADGGGTYLSADSISPGERASAGWLLWVRTGTLVAQRLEMSRRARSRASR